MFQHALDVVARFFASGGPFMWLILLLFASALAVIVERLVFYLGTSRVDAPVMFAETVTLLNEDRVDLARKRLHGGTGPLTALFDVALARFEDGLTMPEIRQWVEEVAIREVPRYAHRINYLAMFANIATLTGLLGTIFGLQQSFSSLAVVEASEKAAMLASGISQAMNTTAFGLMVAIPCLIAYSKLTNMQTGRTEELDACTVRLLNYMESKRKAESWNDGVAVVSHLVGRDNMEAPLSARS